MTNLQSGSDHIGPGYAWQVSCLAFHDIDNSLYFLRDQYSRIVLRTSTRHQDRARKLTDDWRWSIGHIRINEIGDTDSTNPGID